MLECSYNVFPVYDTVERRRKKSLCYNFQAVTAAVYNNNNNNNIKIFSV